VGAKRGGVYKQSDEPFAAILLDGHLADMEGLLPSDDNILPGPDPRQPHVDDAGVN